jgi:hypothetical protein
MVWLISRFVRRHGLSNHDTPIPSLDRDRSSFASGNSPDTLAGSIDQTIKIIWVFMSPHTIMIMAKDLELLLKAMI